MDYKKRFIELAGKNANARVDILEAQRRVRDLMKVEQGTLAEIEQVFVDMEKNRKDLYDGFYVDGKAMAVVRIPREGFLLEITRNIGYTDIGYRIEVKSDTKTL